MKRREFVKIAGISALCCGMGYKFLRLNHYDDSLEYRNFYEKAFDGTKNLLYLEIHLADYCNLNCKYCSHFSPIADAKSYELSEFERDMSQLAKITNSRIRKIRLMGGEPLLNKDINKYLKITRKLFPRTGIYLVTNGLLLNSMKEDFWKCMSKNNICLEPSLYKVNIDLQTIFNKAKIYNVPTTLTQDIIDNIDKNYVENFIKLNLDLKASQKNMFLCRECMSYKCINLYEGKLYACPVIAYVKYFNKKFNKNIQVSKGDYLELNEITNFDQILDWSSNSPIPFCKYCGKWEIAPWERSDKHTSDEWAV